MQLYENLHRGPTFTRFGFALAFSAFGSRTYVLYIART